MKLVIGNLNYSSWSLRGWLALKAAGVAFETETVALFSDGYRERLLAHSPAGLVPILIDGDLTVHDSLAIGEYLAESCPTLWPQDRATRARARAVSAEMHSGFTAVRSIMPMNLRATGRRVETTSELSAEIERIHALWRHCLSQSAGPWLFGDYSLADIMYAPVVARFHTYGVTGDGAVGEWMTRLRDTPAMIEALDIATAEEAVIEAAEVGR